MFPPLLRRLIPASLRRPRLVFLDEGPGRLVLPMKFQVGKAAGYFNPQISRFVGMHMQAYEYEHGIPERLFALHAQSDRVFHLTEICVHGAWLDTFISAPKRLDLASYKTEIKRLALGLTSHNRQPGIMEHTKFLAGHGGGTDTEYRTWFDMDNSVIFTFDVELAKSIMVGPTARLGTYPVPVEDEAIAA